MKIEHHGDYAARRREAYPPLVEQVAAMQKGGAEAEAMLALIAEVKARFPKPQP